jgi:hypothetical protein
LLVELRLLPGLDSLRSIRFSPILANQKRAPYALALGQRGGKIFGSISHYRLIPRENRLTGF